MNRILFFFCLITAGICQTLDVETLPRLRTTQYSMGDCQKIVVFSAPRTGSSLIYNVCRFLFEKDENLSKSHRQFSRNQLVLKTHRLSQVRTLKGNKILYVVSIRDPLETSLSTYRILPQKPDDLRYWCKKVVYNQVDSLAYAEQKEAVGGTVLFIKYEDVEGDLDRLIQLFENYFSISISDFDKHTMRVGYSKENVQRNIHSFVDFREYLPISGFHGKHVASETFFPPSDVVDLVSQYLQEVAPLFRKYGYEFDGIDGKR